MPAIKNHKVDLRAMYSRNIKLCIIIAVALIIAAFKISPTEDSISETIIQPQDIITIENIINTVQKPKIPDPPAKPKIIEASIEDITEDFILEDIDIFENVTTTQSPARDRPKIVDEDIIFVW